jgi:hypothetical protein
VVAAAAAAVVAAAVEEEEEEEEEGAAEGAGAAFRGTGPELRSASRSQSIQNPPRIGSSQLRARSLLWP